MKLVGGSCAAGAALSSCQSSLFASAGGGGASASSSSAGASVSARLLVVMMAGKSTDSITSSASAIKESGVKILCLGLGGSYDKEQMTTMASSAEYFLSVSTFSALSGISQQFIGLISQGKPVMFSMWSYYGLSRVRYDKTFFELHTMLTNLGRTPKGTVLEGS